MSANVRDAAHSQFVEHQSRYNQYGRVLESMVSVMEKHFAQAKEEPKEGASLLEVGGDKDTLEWESPDAHKEIYINVCVDSKWSFGINALYWNGKGSLF